MRISYSKCFCCVVIINTSKLHGNVHFEQTWALLHVGVLSMFVLCLPAGLNMLSQARQFNETVKLTGIVLTKLDGTAR